jgi:predicted dehydrogenase/threonine dehydrogenase-like Zn-dependent dehydrogenase
MKQVVQSIRGGSIGVVDSPFPQLGAAGALVRTSASLISAGTERATLDFAKGSLLEKARSRPDLVKQVLGKMRRDGIVQAARTALARLDRPVSPGYACAGTVIGTSPGLSEIAVGDRVACAGAGYATHAEVNFIPKNLMVPIPRRATGEWVGFDEAAFTTLGAIALHGVRLGKPELGDRAVVIGLGLVGLLAIQILRAHGCEVLGVDLDSTRCDLARQIGAEIAVHPGDAEAAAAAWSGAFGADLVLVTAASESSAPAVLAAELARDKGRLVAVGTTGLDLPRRTLYHKELSVVVSRSYGPGRYDPEYEERGRAYPLAHVRWTERENMRAFLGLLANDRVDVGSLISHRFSVHDATSAYETLEGQSALGIVIEYPQEPVANGPVHVRSSSRGPETATAAKVGVSFIGAGNFAHAVLLPAVKRNGLADLRGVVTATGPSGRSTAEKFGFAYCTTTADDVLTDDRTQAAIISTRHDAHASLVMRALDAGRAVFVEKPLCLTPEELETIVARVRSLESSGRQPFVMVGFNRRFAPMVEPLRTHFQKTPAPVKVIYRVNAGQVPSTNWLVSEEQGGRVIGEVCHFVDLCAFLAGAPIEEVFATRSSAGVDDVVVTLRMTGGSVATVAYMVDGDRGFPKERLEVFGSGSIGVIDDFRFASLSVRGRTKRMTRRFAAQDKGHNAEIAAFFEAVATSGSSPIPFEAVANTMRATFAILQSIETGHPVRIQA